VESDAVLQAVAAYWNWSKAHYSVAALEVSVERMQSHAADMHTLLDAGMATENDVLATEVQLDQTRLGLAEGRRRVKLMRARIADITGRELPGDAVPVEASAPSGAPPPSEAELLDLAGAGRSERLALEKETASAEALARASRSDLYPQISLTARYEQARPNGLFFPPADEWNDEAFAGVSVNWQIFDWGRTQAASREAGARAAQARLRQAQVGEQIALEVREARINLADALEKAAVATRAQASAERNLEVATDLWKSGLARHSELLDAHARLAQAQREAVVARADVRLAEAALEHATGRTAERNIGGSE
jgi:outer membrane protein TolC